MDTMTFIWLLFWLVFLISLVGLFIYKLKFSYTIGLVIFGLILALIGQYLSNNAHPAFSALAVLSKVKLNENLVLYAFLPPIIFQAAIGMDVTLFRKNLVPILTLALPGVIFTTIVVGIFVHLLTPLTIGAALIFGALISTTDPVAVIAMFKELKVSKRITMLVDGESLFNDATAIVAFGLMTGIVQSGEAMTGGTIAIAILKFVAVFAGGFVLGCAIGFICGLLNRLAKRICGHDDRAMFSGLTSIAAALGAFLLAQGVLGLSGVMCCVGTAWTYVYMLKKDSGQESIDRLNGFWDVFGFLANSLIFLVLGMSEINLLFTDWLLKGIAFTLVAAVIVFVSRIVLIFGAVPIVNAVPKQEKIPFKSQIIMLWGGLRGALPIGLAVSVDAAALGISNAVVADEQRDMIILFTVGVVIWTLILQGLTIKPIIRKLGLAADNEGGKLKLKN